MTNQELCEYLFTQNPNAEVTAWFQGQTLEVKDIHDTELILDPIKRKKKEDNE